MPFNSKVYDINWPKLMRWLTPFRWRNDDYMAMLLTLTTPLNLLHTQFLYFKGFIDYRLSITPQAYSLENLLNDRFDTVQRRIYIVNAVAHDGIPFFLKVEGKPQKFFRKYEAVPRVLYTKQETTLFTVDFVVMVPIGLVFDENELRAYLDIDVLPSKVYSVQTF